MNFNKHYNLAGKHAFLSPSTHSWLHYDEDKLRRVYFQRQQTERGSRLHDLAKNLIELGVKLPDTQTTLNMYVNDALGFRMSPEVPLVYTEDCFGTADALSFRQEKIEKNRLVLRVSDLKTGESPASMEQPLIYAAIFFLEYGHLFDIHDVVVILRLYQNDEILEHRPAIDELLMTINQIQTQAAIIAMLREEDM